MHSTQKRSKKCLVIVRGAPRNTGFPGPNKTLLWEIGKAGGVWGGKASSGMIDGKVEKSRKGEEGRRGEEERRPRRVKGYY